MNDKCHFPFLEKKKFKKWKHRCSSGKSDIQAIMVEMDSLTSCWKHFILHRVCSAAIMTITIVNKYNNILQLVVLKLDVLDIYCQKWDVLFTQPVNSVAFAASEVQWNGL